MPDPNVERGATGAPATPPDYVRTYAAIADFCGRSVPWCQQMARRQHDPLPLLDARGGRRSVIASRVELEAWLQRQRASEHIVYQSEHRRPCISVSARFYAWFSRKAYARGESMSSLVDKAVAP